MAHAHAARDRRGDEPRKPRGAEGTPSDGKAAYLADIKSSSSQMKRPSTGASLSWRCASFWGFSSAPRLFLQVFSAGHHSAWAPEWCAAVAEQID